MLVIAPITGDDVSTIVMLWNSKRLDEQSCWYEADPIDTHYVEQLQAAGLQIALARLDDEPAGFGLWCAAGDYARLVAIAADEPHVYYHLMAAYCDWALAQHLVHGFAELGAGLTTERQRMDALEVIQYTTIGYEPQPPGQQGAPRIARLLRAECELSMLSVAIQSRLENLS